MKKHYIVWLLWPALLLCIWLGHLVPAMLAGMTAYACIAQLEPLLANFHQEAAKKMAIGVVMAFIVVVIAAIAWSLVHIVQNQSWLAVLEQMKNAVDNNATVKGWLAMTPIDIGHADAYIKEWINGHKAEVAHLGKNGLHIVIQCVLASIVGALFASHHGEQHEKPRVIEYWNTRCRLWYQSFTGFMGAQVKISAVNTVFTGIFLAVIFPLIFGSMLPMTWFLILLTFVLGLVPILGNVMSNTILTVLALSISLPAAIACLVFLVVIHKLEYFINAKIMGGNLNAATYEMLAVIIIAEACFGLSGVVMAPIVYGYIKKELMTIEH